MTCDNGCGHDYKCESDNKNNTLLIVAGLIVLAVVLTAVFQ
jgi:hypothetical protein